MPDTFTASSWCNGFTKRSVCYGMRFGVAGREFISGRPAHIRLALGGMPEFDVPLTPGFWKKCPEVRHHLIGVWFHKLKLKRPWPDGEPHRFHVTKVAANSFAVTVDA